MPKAAKPHSWGTATLAIHGHARRRKAHHAVSTPIVQTSNGKGVKKVSVPAIVEIGAGGVDCLIKSKRVQMTNGIFITIFDPFGEALACAISISDL
jgi:hypothetical protein